MIRALLLASSCLLAESVSLGGQAAPRHAQHRAPAVQAVFRAPQSTDTAAADQLARLQESGLSPSEYAEATRARANAYLTSPGAHAAPASAADGSQQASFLELLWGVQQIPALPREAASDPTRVIATIYEIGGPLTNVLSTSVAKQLPLIPHIGIRCHGVEYFYSDHIECRTVPVMQEMLKDCPQVSLDLGPAQQNAEEVAATVAALEPNWEAKDYHVFDKNCVHFADALAARVCADERGVPTELLQGVIDVSERMLDSLPEWRRKLGRRVMNEVTRLVVVSWGKQTSKKKEQVADNLGLERGA